MEQIKIVYFASTNTGHYLILLDVSLLTYRAEHFISPTD